MSGHKLNVETGRYGSRTGSRHHRICEFCSEKSMMELFVNLPCVDPIIEDEKHFLRTCRRYHSSRTNMKEPTKSLLFHDMKSLCPLSTGAHSGIHQVRRSAMQNRIPYKEETQRLVSQYEISPFLHSPFICTHSLHFK